MATAPVKFPKASEVRWRLNEDDVAEINRVASNSFQSKEDLIQHLRRMSTITLAGGEMVLEPGLIKRLQSRQQGPDFGKFVREIAMKALFEYAGI